MKQWENALVGPDTPLVEAIRVLDREALRIVMVIDAQRRLLGTLTDGDIRRALLRQVPLEAPASTAMHTQPKTARGDWSEDRILAVMREAQLLQIPIVDDQGRVVGLETLHGLLGRQRRDNPVFLMAGGFGTRLRPLTQDCPKPLLNVGEKPILERIVESFANAGFHRFFISTHYMADRIRNHFGDGSQWGVSIRYVHEEQPLGTGGALGLLPHDEIDLPLFVMNGDLLTNLSYRNLLDFHEQEGGIATMCVREFEYQVPYGVIESEGNLIRGMIEKPVQRFFINAGIYLLSPALVRRVPPQTRVDMPSLLEQAIAAGEKVTMFPIREYWLDVGKMEDFQRAQVDVLGLPGN